MAESKTEETVQTMPMALVVEGQLDKGAVDAFPVLLEDIKQALSKHDGGDGIEVKMVHLYIRGSAEKVAECVTKIHEESD